MVHLCNKLEWRPEFVKEAIDYVRKNADKVQGKDSYLNSVRQKQLMSGLEDKI